MFAEFRSEGLKSKTISEEAILIVFNPIVNLNVLERHQAIANFVFVGYFTLMEVGGEVLYKLCENCRGDVSGCQNGSRFVTVVEFDCCHVMRSRNVRCGRHREAIVFGRVGRRCM